MSARKTSYASHASFLSSRNRRNARKAQFTLLVCGSPGTGKTTFINNLVGRRIFHPTKSSAPTSVELAEHTVNLEEDDGTRLTLTVIDTVGFGARADASEDAEFVGKYIEARYDEILAEESRIRRNARSHDPRIHACVYFVHPSPHGLSALDINALARLGPVVNVVLAIGRADQMTVDEREQIHKIIREDVVKHKLFLFDFAGDDEISELVRQTTPFSVVSSTEYDENERPTYRCKLAHGTVDVVNPAFSDFVILRDTLLGTFRDDFEDSTRGQLYEAYRTLKLTDPELHANRDSVLQPEELVAHGNKLKEEQLRRDNATFRKEEERVQQEIDAKRRQLLIRERELRELELRLTRERAALNAASASPNLSVSGQSASDIIDATIVPPPPHPGAQPERSSTPSSFVSTASRPQTTQTAETSMDSATESHDSAPASSGPSLAPVAGLSLPNASSQGQVYTGPPRSTNDTVLASDDGTPAVTASQSLATLSEQAPASLNGDHQTVGSPHLPPRSPNRPPSVHGSLSPLLVKKNSMQFKDIPPQSLHTPVGIPTEQYHATASPTRPQT